MGQGPIFLNISNILSNLLLNSYCLLTLLLSMKAVLSSLEYKPMSVMEFN